MVDCAVLSSLLCRCLQCRLMREIKDAATRSTFFVLAINQPIAIGQGRSSAKAVSSVPSLNTNLELSNDLIPSLSVSQPTHNEEEQYSKLQKGAHKYRYQHITLQLMASSHC